MSQHIDEFDILLEHDIDQQYQYEPGELLCGRVRVVVREPIKISAIHVQIRGESNVSWDEGDDARGDPITCAAEDPVSHLSIQRLPLLFASRLRSGIYLLYPKLASKRLHYS